MSSIADAALSTEPEVQRGWIYNMPFVDFDIFAKSPRHEQNGIRILARLVVAQWVLLTGILTYEGWVLAGVDATQPTLAPKTLMVAAFATAIGYVVSRNEAIAVATILKAGANGIGPFGWVALFFKLAFRSMSAVASAGLIVIVVSLRFFATDISADHRADWERANKAKIAAAQRQFEKSLMPQKVAIANLKIEIAELLGIPDGDVSAEDKEIARLRKVVMKLKSEIAALEKQKIFLINKQTCERHGFGQDCFGASNDDGPGPRFKIIGIKISEKEDQIRLRRKRLTTAEDDLKKMIGRRGEILDKAGLQVRREKLVDRRRALEVAEAELVSAEANRARAIAEAVPYVPPGVREQFSLLLRTTFTDPVAGVLGALVFLFAMGVELGSFATAFSKRDSAYAIQLRDQLCDALHASETRKILNQSELEDLKWEKKQQRLWRGQQYSTSEKIVRGLEDIDPSAARKVA